jgi:hypothetical protein
MVRVSGSGIGSGEGDVAEGEGETICGGDVGPVGVVGVVDGVGVGFGVVDGVGVGFVGIEGVCGEFCADDGAGLGFGLLVDETGGGSVCRSVPTRGCQKLNRAGLRDCLQSKYWTFGSASGSELWSARFIST